MNPDKEFIAAKESAWFIALFDLYVRNLFRRRFQRVWVHQEYAPLPENKTIYYLNHTSWWDGLIPLLLNRKLFRQNARAMMEDRQMRQHPFFKKIGAFSVNLENPRAAVRSLRYAVNSMQKPGASLFIYPEGKIVPLSTKTPAFKKGLSWIASKTSHTDVVPIGIYMHTVRSAKPELFIKIGSALHFHTETDLYELNKYFENELALVLKDLRSQSLKNHHGYKKLI